MKGLFGILLGLTLVASPAFAAQVTVDYAHDFDFKKVKTFEYVETTDSNAKDPLMDGRIKSAIIDQLKAGGLKQVDSDPDIHVTYHISTKDNTVYNTSSFGYGGLGLGWGGWGGMGASTTTTTTFTEGTLIVDGYEATEKKVVWRGVGTVTLKAKPEKVTQQIDKIIAEMSEKWKKILQNQGE